MTLREFARRTGWPYRELLALRWTEFNELLALYGLRLIVSPLNRRRSYGRFMRGSNYYVPADGSRPYRRCNKCDRWYFDHAWRACPGKPPKPT